MRPADALKAKMEAFKLASCDKVCRGCGHWWDPYRSVSHHGVYRQHLKVEQEWRVENVVPLCSDCHEKHHNRSRVLSADALSEENVAFAKEVLGDAAEYYIARYYSPSSTTDA